MLQHRKIGGKFCGRSTSPVEVCPTSRSVRSDVCKALCASVRSALSAPNFITTGLDCQRLKTWRCRCCISDSTASSRRPERLPGPQKMSNVMMSACKTAISHSLHRKSRSHLLLGLAMPSWTSVRAISMKVSRSGVSCSPSCFATLLLSQFGLPPPFSPDGNSYSGNASCRGVTPKKRVQHAAPSGDFPKMVSWFEATPDCSIHEFYILSDLISTTENIEEERVKLLDAAEAKELKN